jgi:hypothetical protein
MEQEQIESLINDKSLPPFPLIYRCRFTGDSRRVYFRKSFNQFYSGITSAISASGLSDKTFLNKARVNMAFEGIDADEVWGEKRDYGSVFHLLVSMHERTDDGHRPFVFDEDSEHGIAWRSDVRNWAIQYGCPHNQDLWIDQVQNDFAAWFQFKRDYNVRVMASEIPVFNDKWLIATPMDIVCEMDFNKKRIFANINLKTGTASSIGKDYTLQVCMEQQLWDDTMREKKCEQFLLGGTFIFRPKDRQKAPCKYELSKNFTGTHSMEEMEYIATGVKLNRSNWPKGKIRTFTGDEKTFTYTEKSAQEFLDEFNAE